MGQRPPYLLITNKLSHLETSGQYVTPQYTSYSGRLYNTQTGEEITNPDETTKKDNEAIRKAVATQLSMSDAVQTGDLLRFYTPNGLNLLIPARFPTRNRWIN